MRVVLQRVLKANVSVNNNIVGQINKGIVIFVGFISSDNDKVIEYIIDKVINLRIFEDENDKMNLSLIDVKGELLIIPNFTLYGDARKGRRPSYSNAASPKDAELIYNNFIEKAKKLDLNVQTGIFQADMKVEIVNDGPINILIDSDKNF